MALTTGIPATEHWEEVAEFADLLIICIRHNQVLPFLDQATNGRRSRGAFVCLASGVLSAELRKRAALSATPVVRAVTNINVASRSGLTIVLREPLDASEHACEQAIQLF